MANYQKILPKISEETKEFWEGCKKHELRIQRCKKCGTYRFPPRPMCYRCNSMDVEWAKVSGKGNIYAFTVVHSAGAESPLPGFESEYPYAVVLVELPNAGGVRILSNMVDCELSEIRIGMPVEVVFEPVSEEITLPKFKRLR